MNNNETTYEAMYEEHVGDRDANIKATYAQETGRYDEWD